jgi:hypothetical protein
LTRAESEWAATDHVGQGFEGAARAELQRGAEGVPDGQAEETSSKPLALIHDAHAVILRPLESINIECISYESATTTF